MSSTNRGSTRIDRDAYQTPSWCIDLIFKEISWPNVESFGEPCIGTGNILHLVPIDIHAEWAEIEDGLDYFDITFDVDLIVTNPPFSQALKFLQKSLNEAKTVIYLLRLNYLGSKNRKEFWNDNQPSHLFALSRRPSFTPDGKTDSIEYSWFCWDGGNLLKRSPGIYVL